MQNNILFTFAIIFSIFYCALAQGEFTNPRIDRNTNFGLGFDKNYIFDRYTVPELQRYFVFPFIELVKVKPSKVCVYENPVGLKNTNIKLGSWYPLDLYTNQQFTDAKRFQQRYPAIFPSTDPSKTLCLQTDGTAPIYRYYENYPGNLWYYYRGLVGEHFADIFQNNGIKGITDANRRFIVTYPSETKLYFSKTSLWRDYSIRHETLKDQCKKCPCAIKKDTCSNDEIYFRVQ